MKIGTKSVLFGAHCFLIHPFFVMAAWWKLYGFPNKIQYWVAFFVHDLGYWGKPNMDGQEGEEHVVWGAKVMRFLFDMDNPSIRFWFNYVLFHFKLKPRINNQNWYWYNFSLYHSRFYAKKDGVNPSRLCVADKYAIYLEPWWLYLPRVTLSGEIKEYMALAKKREGDGENINKYQSMKLNSTDKREWFEGMTSYLQLWALTHKYDQKDTWTPDVKKLLNDNGVWQ